MSVVGYSHTTWSLTTTRPSGAKVELSVQDASVPPTGVRPSGSIQYALRAKGPRNGPTVLRRLVDPLPPGLTPQSSYSTMK